MQPSSHPRLSDHEHAKFVELCALYSTGSLSGDEMLELTGHLAECDECRQLLADYQALVRAGIPLLADDSVVELKTGFDRELAETKKRLFAQLTHTETDTAETIRRERFRLPGLLLDGHLPKYAAAALLVACVGLGSYTIGVRKSPRLTPTQIAADQSVTLRAQLLETMKQRDSLERLIDQREQELKIAAAEIDQQAKDSTNLRRLLDESDAGKSQETSVVASLGKENSSLKAERDGIVRSLEDAQANLTRLKQQVDELGSERVPFQMEIASKDKTINELTAQISEQERLLTADRDIRELMGARELLISDVIDVDTKGRSKQPFGRIFYTKNKSLVFYAFDLDKQPGVHNASTFQAWGARATSLGNQNPVSMGIFYMDNVTARRWVLKLDNPKVLERIDSVFVTIEPKGGSHKPSGKQLLFSYLRGEANHP